MVSGVSKGVSPLYRKALVTSVAGVFPLYGGYASAYRRRVVGCASPQSAIFAPVITL